MWVAYLHTMYNYEDKQTLQKYENIMANSVFTQYTFLFISVLSLFKFFCLSLLQGHSLKSFHKSSNWFLRAGPAFVMCLNNTLAWGGCNYAGIARPDQLWSSTFSHSQLTLLLWASAICLTFPDPSLSTCGPSPAHSNLEWGDSLNQNCIVQTPLPV